MVYVYTKDDKAFCPHCNEEMTTWVEAGNYISTFGIKEGEVVELKMEYNNDLVLYFCPHCKKEIYFNDEFTIDDMIELLICNEKEK